MPAASSIYWDSVDSQRSSGSSADASGSGRHYVDPWDLENYAYLRRHSVATPVQSTPVAPRHRHRPSLSARTESEYSFLQSKAREPGYNAPATVEEIHLGVSRQSAHYCYQPIYEDDSPNYATSPPLYAPLFADLEAENESGEDQRTKEMLRLRSKLTRVRDRHGPREECIYHGCPVLGPSEDLQPPKTVRDEVSRFTDVVPPSHLGLNTYGHLKIDYTNSWNSLHRKIYK
ncbi:uncharacterized protein LOC105700825 [Orussus abietinus]|uniref:uncharacterized protein LOC105700825 n=1 Tax=Orussus abietinus TaxID=222816 RepID=UPI000626907E|nr:uncharacterized protein LOC105700825 [Orussus abietinus]